MSGKLLREIKQSRPFKSLQEEAVLNMARTLGLFEQAWTEALKPSGLSATQYNALRILRGAGHDGLACQQIAERMIRRDPDITRLLDRLEARGLIGRTRSREDRRVVVTRITKAGLALLSSLDPAVADLPEKWLAHMGGRRLRQLIDLLEEARERP